MSYRISDKMKHANVNMPVNNVSVSVNNQVKSMKNFTVKPNKIDDVKISNIETSNVNISSKNIAVAVQKQSKFVDNISIYTEPIKTQFDLQKDYTFDLEQQHNNEIQVDTKGSFDF